MPLERQHILLSYFKTLSVGPVWGSNPRPPMCIAMTYITGATLVAIGVYAMYASWNVINVIINEARAVKEDAYFCRLISGHISSLHGLI